MQALLLLDVHKVWAWVMVLSNAAVGGWALAAHQWEVVRTKALWWAVAGAEGTIFVQVIIGAIVLNRYDFELPQLHALYGFSCLIAIGVIYSYRNQMQHRLYLLYGFGSLFIMGMGIRAMILR